MEKYAGWSAKKRDEHINQAQKNNFDLIIIGGGITGAGIAREAALRNISFCILDKNDFGFGTSSRSSKLAHGGVRYLANGEFRLVRESTTERNWLRTHFPNLARPVGFMVCTYKKGKDKPLNNKIALKLYDLLSNWFSNFKNYRKSKFFQPEFIEEFEPAISQYDPELGHMRMAGFFYDTNIDDSRLTLETIKESLTYSKGNSIAINYAEVDSPIRNEQGKIKGVQAIDHFTKKSFKVNGKVVVVCCGIWTDLVMKKTGFGSEKIYQTKGVHIAVPNERLGNRNAFGVRSFDDNRFFFILRRGKISLIGTTDTDYFKESKNLDEPWCTKEDCDYLFKTVNRLFPDARLGYNDIIGTYAGIRPLIRQDGVQNESEVSRKHEIFESNDNIVAIAGGKLTTFRLMTEELLFFLVEKGYLPSFSNPDYSKKGFSKKPFNVGITRADFNKLINTKGFAEILRPEQLEHLHRQYGKQGIEILDKIKAKPKLGSPILDGYPYCEAEIKFILDHENAPCLIDVLCRRTEAQWTIWHYKQGELARKTASIMAKYYKWPVSREKAEITNYNNYIKNTIWF